MAKRNIGVTLECFVKKNGRYLMLQRSVNKRIMPGVWMAPGGHREHNEGVFECARREILEETGLKIKNLKIRATGCAYMRDIDQELFFHFLTANYAEGRLRQNIKDGKLVWLSPKEIMAKRNLLTEIREVFPHIISRDPKVISYKAEYDKGNNMIKFEIER